MSDKHFLEMKIQMEDSVLEKIKALCRNQGFPGLSGANAVSKGLELFMRDADAVKLLPPDRKEIETRSAIQVPIRSSKDILRAFERVAGGPDSVLVPIDPAIASVMRDTAIQLGWTYSEFCKIAIETSYADQSLDIVEVKPLFFKSREWESLLRVLNRERIRSGGELLQEIIDLRAKYAALAEQIPAEAPPIAEATA